MSSLALFVVVAVAIVLLGVVVGVVAFVNGRKQPPARPTQTRQPSSDTLLADPPPVATPEADVATPAAPAPEVEDLPALVERPEGTAGRLVRLRQRLARSQGALGRSLLALLSRDRLDESTWEELEDTLITADVGVGPTQELVGRLRTRLRVEGTDAAESGTVLREELLALVDPTMDRRIGVRGADGKPGVVLVVGVNGSGKTTSCGKIARVLVAEDLSVVLGAADTFRAAASEQLSTWGERVGVDVVTGPEGSDPASVAFESVRTGVERGVDVVVIDTAGRLQNKAGLMDELGKVKRVVEKHLTDFQIN